MGTDIHCQIEYKLKGDKNWHWIFEGVSDKVNSGYINPLHLGRNYSLFAILADVRNGYGCAGCDTGDGFNYISEPKGLPNNMSTELKKELSKEDGCWLGDHSYSHLTQKELNDFDWEQTTKHRAYVGVEGYKYFKENNKPPQSYCGDVSGKKVIKLTNLQMDNIIEFGDKKELEKNKNNTYTQIEWEIKYEDDISFDTLWNLKHLDWFFNNRDNIKDTRIVFGFDS